jgi:hypothetical protein
MIRALFSDGRVTRVPDFLGGLRMIGDSCSSSLRLTCFMKKYSLLLIGLASLIGCSTAPQSERNAGPWDLAELKRTPATEWGTRTGLLQEVIPRRAVHDRLASLHILAGQRRGEGRFQRCSFSGGGKPFPVGRALGQTRVWRWQWIPRARQARRPISPPRMMRASFTTLMT